jgi:hypothetical protein
MSLHRCSSQGKLLDAFGREKERDHEEEQSARGGGATNGKQTTLTNALLPSLQRRNGGPRRPRASDAAQHHPATPPPHAGHRHHHHHPHPHPPMPPAPQLTVSSRWYRAPALYTCRVVHDCDPPGGVQYYGLPFFKLSLDEIYHVLKEAGHPSRHRDLPLMVDEGDDCLLLARDEGGELGWLLASFLYPVD